MGVVMLLNYYVDEENLEMLFSFSQNIDNSPYYVHMANAWLISVCMAKYPTRTIVFFKHNTLDAKTHNRAIQKSCESYRVSKEHKATIRLLKR
jgi:3-methyladenine DNA glycosylase AlkD